MIRIGTVAGGHMKPGQGLRGVASHQLADVGEHTAKGRRPNKPDLGICLQRGIVIRNT